MVHELVRGGGFELSFLDHVDLVERLLRRFRRAERRADGSIYIQANNSSGIVPARLPDQPSLIRQDQWRAVIHGPGGLIDEVVAAEVIGVEKGAPGVLRLGEEITLGVRSPVDPASSTGFLPTDEDLEGFELVEIEEDEASEAPTARPASAKGASSDVWSRHERSAFA